jgi:hypothetical protein
MKVAQSQHSVLKCLSSKRLRPVQSLLADTRRSFANTGVLVPDSRFFRFRLLTLNPYLLP